jgi:putative ABC transport system permease protein
MLVDLRHLVRSLRRSPASATAAVLTLSLTLGAGASIFAVVDAVLFTPPPFEQPESLVRIGETPIDDPSATPRTLTYATLDAWRERAASMATFEAFDGTNLTLTDLGPAERVSGVNATPGLLPLLGISPALGRLFTDSEMGGAPVVVLSDAFWRAKFAGDRDVLGRQLTLGSQRHTIVGILPKDFVFGLNSAHIWRPLPVTPAQALTSGYRVTVVARVAQTVSLEDLTAALDDIGRLSAPPTRAVVTPIAKVLAGDAPRTLGLLAGAAGLAMLIAFINLAGLLVVRSIDRRRELAVRSALGAHNFEIAKQLLLEAQALVVLGTIGGVLLALWITPAAGRLASQVARIAPGDVSVSWRVILLVSVLASALAWICGLIPALAASRRNIVDVLRRGATRHSHDLMLRRVFVAGEIALAFVLLVSVTLLGRSLIRVLNMTSGFDARGVMVMHVALPGASYPNAERVTAFYDTLQRQLQGRLGPHAVSIVDELPLTGDRGRSAVSLWAGESGREAVVRSAAPDYFDVMRIPVTAGRGFEPGDNASTPTRVVLSDGLAQRLFGSQSPIGRRVRVASIGRDAEVIGVAGDVKHRALDESLTVTIYVSSLQVPSNSSIIVVRSALADGDVLNAVRDEAARLDRSLPVYGARTLQDVVAASPGVPVRRVLTATFTGFALLGIVLGGIGLFGVLAHDVASRRTELALRIALGADPVRMLGAVARQGALILGSGLLVGGLLSIWASRLLGGLILATGDLDLLTIGAPSAVLLIAGAIAVLPVGRRAAHIDPLAALRSE